MNVRPAAAAVPAAEAVVPLAATVRPSAITPLPPEPAAAPAAAAPTAGAQGTPGLTGMPATTGAPAASSAPPRNYPNLMQGGARPRSLAEMAREQLNGGRGPRDPLAQGMGEAALPDCIAPNPQGSLLGVFTLPYAAATGKCKPPR